MSQGGLESFDGVGDLQCGGVDGANLGSGIAVQHVIGELLCVGQFLFGLGFHPVAHAHQAEVVENVGELEVDQGGFEFCGYLLVECFCECVTEFHSHESTMPSIDLCLPNSLVGGHFGRIFRYGLACVT